MPYTKPYTYVDGTILGSTDQNSNDYSAKKYINQDVVASDISANILGLDNFQRGELNPIINHHQFTTGEVFGRFNDNLTSSRSYFTSETKANDQTASTSVQYQPIFETGDTVILERDGTVFITLGMAVISEANDIETKGKWDSLVILAYESGNTVTYLTQTSSYTFEETATVASAGVKDPGSFNWAWTDQDEEQNRRWIGWEYMVTLSAGTYRFYTVVNPKVEQGFAGSRSYTLEVFYT
jgi:hypothetical protein